MSARVRMVQPLAGPSSQRRQIAQLPEYEPPQFTMTVDAQRKLADLASRPELNKVFRDLDAAITTLSTSVADINERLTERRERLQKQQKQQKRQNGTQELSGSQPVNEDEEGNSEPLEGLTSKVENMTKRLEAGMRQAIDAQESITHIQEALRDSSNHARAQASTQASVQATRSQRRPRARDDDDEHMEDEEEDEEYPEIHPTGSEAATQTVTAPSAFFNSKVDDWSLAYSARSKFERYAQHNEYRHFRRLLHNAQFPDDSVKLPAPEKWFDEGSLARPGVTEPANDDDEDLQMTRATTSTKCPITLQEFQHPLTSKKCSHTFEAEAIREMIARAEAEANQRPSTRGPRSVGTVRCPVQSCAHMLTMNDLHVDEIITRRIRSLQRAQQLRDQEMQDPDGANHEVIDDEDDAYDVDEIEDDVVPSTKMKSEMRSSRV